VSNRVWLSGKSSWIPNYKSRNNAPITLNLSSKPVCLGGCKDNLAYRKMLRLVYFCLSTQADTTLHVHIYCTMFGVLDQFWPPVVPCYSTEDAVRIGNSFITIPITRNYNHSQLFLMLLRVYTIVLRTHSWLQSLITLLHVYAGWLLSYHYCLKLSQTLLLHTLKLSPRSHSANSPLKTAT
jgi:hypothetical protein